MSIKNRKELLHRAYYDLRFFILFFLKHHVFDKETGCITPFNQMAIDHFDNFNPRQKKIKKVVMASRGSAKTTLFTLCDLIHRMCFSTVNFTVIFSSTAPLALDKVKDIRSELMMNDRLIDYFNIKFENKRVSTEQFTIKTIFGNSTIKGQSFFSQIRGLKKKEDRPDYMIFDDVIHGEWVFSEVQREKADRQFKTDITNAGQPNTSYLFLGTSIHKEDLINKLSKDVLWDSYFYPSIKKWPKNMDLWDTWEKIILDRDNHEALNDSDDFYLKNKEKMDEEAEILWPEREPLLYLMKLRLQGKRSFGAEKQLIPFLSGEALFKNIKWFKYTEQNGKMGFLIEESGKFYPEDHQRWQIYYALDPATGEKKTQTSKKKLSFSSRIIVYRDIHTNRKFVLLDKTNRDSPTTIIKELIEWNEKYLFQRVGVEGNLFKELFSIAVKNALKDKYSEAGHAFRIPFYEVYNQTEKKHRIYSMEPKIESGEILFCRGLSAEFTSELENFPNCEQMDALDALEIACKITDSRYNLQKTMLSVV